MTMRHLPSSFLLLALAATANSQFTNAFTTTTESWQKIEYNETGNTFGSPSAANFTNARGNPPGALSMTDSLGTYFAFWAPSDYLGDQSQFAGGEIVVDLANSGPTSRNSVDFTIALRGANGTLAGFVSPIQPGAAWTTFRVPMKGSLGWWNISQNRALTDSEFDSVLEDLSGISIMGDFIAGTDTTDVDNFYFGPMLTPNPIEFFNTNAAGWTHITLNPANTAVTRYPAAATYSAASGNPGGAIQNTDLDDNVSFALAPRAFTGSWTSFAQGELSFDIKNVVGSGGGPLTEVHSIVVLTGGGKTFQYTLPTRTANIPTSWTKVFIPMQTSPNWHVGTLTGPQPTAEQFSAMLEHVDGLRIRTEYVSGDETDLLDNVTLLPTNVSSVVSGNVDLGSGWAGDPTGIPVRIGFFRDGWPMGEVATSLDTNGNYSVICPNYGNITVTCKGSHWLRSAESASFVGNGTPRTVNFTLVNGDVDDDNTVSVFDYLVLSDAFDADSSASNWDARADLDGDGVISVFDYLILSENFDREGTPFE